MSYRDQLIARFGLRVIIPAAAVLSALVIVIISAQPDGDEVNNIEDRLTARSVEAALQVTVRNLEQTHRDYAQWDDAVRNAYGDVNQTFMEETYGSSTTVDHVLFDTVMLVDEVGRVRYAVRRGEPVTESPAGPGPPRLTRIARLRRCHLRRPFGHLVTAGDLVVSVGTVAPFSPDFSRRWTLAAASAAPFDEEVVAHFARTTSINDLRPPTRADPHSLPVRRFGQAGSRLAWFHLAGRPGAEQGEPHRSPLPWSA
jgi:hypothetical protein